MSMSILDYTEKERKAKAARKNLRMYKRIEKYESDIKALDDYEKKKKYEKSFLGKTEKVARNVASSFSPSKKKPRNYSKSHFKPKNKSLVGGFLESPRRKKKKDDDGWLF